jgi:hypothetical protein
MVAADCTMQASCSEIMQSAADNRCNAYTDCMEKCGLRPICN